VKPRGSARTPARRSALSLAATLVAAAALGLAAWLFIARERGRTPYGTTPAQRSDYAGSAACAPCHGTEAEVWARSHHGLAMQEPSPRTVLGDFGGATFTDAGVTTRFFTRDARYFVATEGADGKPAEFEVKHVIGVRPVQQYVFEFPAGKIQCLTVAWDTEKRRWYSLYRGQRIALDDPLHWTGRYQNWNLMCAECHTTDFRKGYDAGRDSYASTWAEFDVGCETCHGPRRVHVEQARRGAAPRGRTRPGDLAIPSGRGLYAFQDSAARAGAVLAAARAAVDACAPCHSRRHRVGAARGPRDPFLDEFMPELIREPLYFADGQIHDEVYEYGSFRQSKMYQQGVRCTDCHDPHSSMLRAEGNALCVRCHQPRPDLRFPTLAAKEYEAPSHHHHAPGSAGAQCVACHMPERYYMVVDGRRDHFIRIPRPDVTVAHGTPNACNSCHADRSAAWAARAVDRWYGARARDSAFVQAVAASRAGAPDAAPLLAKLSGDTGRPAIQRATALELLRAYPDQAGAAAVDAARDPDPLVRAAAAGAMETLPHAERAPLAAQLLEDRVRAVRVAAAGALAAIPRALLSARQQHALDAALGECERGLDAVADMPSTHLNRAVLEEARGRDDLAERSYETALRMDPYFLPARANLATLYNRTHRNADAERELREGIRRQPEAGELHYSLGLLLAEEERFDDAARSLASAAELIPQRARVRYNLALVLSKLGREAEAERALLEASRLDPQDPDILYATAYRCAERGEWERALPLALAAAELRPGDADAQGLLQRVRSRLAGPP